ncbi:MAG: hypothetical protein KGJ79_15950 [Alphaproteobacteria bacterium]|nr:hypothetical protein [Alphaproteobacteria bacterium]MDE2493754.1 hypothetical protein [Alphaproteobacteria bacterium]
MDDKPWFRPKVLGYGAGLPICWQGWATVAGFIGATLLGAQLAITYLTGDLRHIALIAAVAVPLAVVLSIVRKKTEGGWHWRDGSHL